jgi:hypothetical protein
MSRRQGSFWDLSDEVSVIPYYQTLHILVYLANPTLDLRYETASRAKK